MSAHNVTFKLSNKLFQDTLKMYAQTISKNSCDCIKFIVIHKNMLQTQLKGCSYKSLRICIYFFKKCSGQTILTNYANQTCKTATIDVSARII